jgi:phenylpropionate dioxygenase-like ring-hydroxylating dioxygenase large terminal subunit
MFLRNQWYVAGWAHQFEPGAIVARKIVDEPLVLYRAEAGHVVAMEDRCCHRFAPLSRGRLEGDAIRCMYHGMKFASDGRCVEIPAQDVIPEGMRVRVHAVVEKDRWVWVWMGDPARADPDLIPHALYHDDPNWLIGTGQMGYDANYQLIHDNLLDLTHLSFVHENTLGRGSPAWGTARPSVTPIDRGVRVSRWLRDRGTSPYVRMPQQKWDAWASYDFVLPGVFLLRTAFYSTATASGFPDGPPGDLEPAYVIVTSQAVTPVSERETIYYYSGGQLRRHGSSALIRDQIRAFGVAFLEDKAMIEAQQKIIDATPDRSMMTLTFDRATAMFRRLMATLIEQEAKNRARIGRVDLAAAQ